MEPGQHDHRRQQRQHAGQHQVHQLVGQAVPSVAPGQANKYFKKTECFCFESQAFAPAEGRDMGLTFMVDPELPTHIDRVTLSYTFFVNQQVAAN